MKKGKTKERRRRQNKLTFDFGPSFIPRCKDLCVTLMQMQITNVKKGILCFVLSSRIFEISKKERKKHTESEEKRREEKRREEKRREEKRREEKRREEKRREEKRAEDGRRRREVVFD